MVSQNCIYIYIYIYIYIIQIIQVGKTINIINNNKIYRINRYEINKIIMTNNMSITVCQLSIYVYIVDIVS